MTEPARTQDPSDRDVIDRVLAGARGDFEILVRRYNQRLYRAARAITRDDQEAEDVLQQGWLQVFRNLGQYRGEAAFSTWATRIVVHEAIAAGRKRPIVAEVRDSVDGDETPDDAVDRVQLGLLLERCLNTIPQGNREVLVMRDVLELDTAETAACLGLTEEAVRVRLHRARAAVAAAIDDRITREARDLYSFLGARCDRMTAAVMDAIRSV
jgi:RNA polymerase sigma-70 factor (ECF subfamily)